MLIRFLQKVEKFFCEQKVLDTEPKFSVFGIITIEMVFLQALHLGLPVSAVPFPHHNQSTRNNFWTSSQSKQVIGVAHPGWMMWKNISSHALVYPQRPLVTGAGDESIRGNDLPAGTNVLMMISPMGGYNQEDALVVNEQSLQNGLFNSIQCDSYARCVF